MESYNIYSLLTFTCEKISPDKLQKVIQVLKPYKLPYSSKNIEELAENGDSDLDKIITCVSALEKMQRATRAAVLDCVEGVKRFNQGKKIAEEAGKVAAKHNAQTAKAFNPKVKVLDDSLEVFERFGEDPKKK